MTHPSTLAYRRFRAALLNENTEIKAGFDGFVNMQTQYLFLDFEGANRSPSEAAGKLLKVFLGGSGGPGNPISALYRLASATQYAAKAILSNDLRSVGFNKEELDLLKVASNSFDGALGIHLRPYGAPSPDETPRIVSATVLGHYAELVVGSWGDACAKMPEVYALMQENCPELAAALRPLVAVSTLSRRLLDARESLIVGNEDQRFNLLKAALDKPNDGGRDDLACANAVLAGQALFLESKSGVSKVFSEAAEHIAEEVSEYCAKNQKFAEYLAAKVNESPEQYRALAAFIKQDRGVDLNTLGAACKSAGRVDCELE